MPHAQETNGSRPAVTPPADIIETERGFEVVLDLPGVPREGLEVAIDDGVLTVIGRPAEAIPEGFAPKARERAAGERRRSFQVPEDVDKDRVEARLDQGVLTLTLPRKREQPRRIEVLVG